jgi:hypothetical protein
MTVTAEQPGSNLQKRGARTAVRKAAVEAKAVAVKAAAAPVARAAAARIPALAAEEAKAVAAPVGAVKEDHRVPAKVAAVVAVPEANTHLLKGKNPLADAAGSSYFAGIRSARLFTKPIKSIDTSSHNLSKLLLLSIILLQTDASCRQAKVQLLR